MMARHTPGKVGKTYVKMYRKKNPVFCIEGKGSQSTVLNNFVKNKIFPGNNKYYNAAVV